MRFALYSQQGAEQSEGSHSDLAGANQLLQHGHATDPFFDQPAINPVPIPDVTQCELYVNNIFVNPEIKCIVSKSNA